MGRVSRGPSGPSLNSIREAVGEEIANAVRKEGVSLRKWTNARLNEMEERVGARFDVMDARLNEMEERVGARFDVMDARLNEMEERVGARFDVMDARFNRLEAMLEGVIDPEFPPIDQQKGPEVKVAAGR